MTREARHLRCPEAVLGWIPWYVEGTLTPRQMGAVEAHAAECADCRAEIDMIGGAPFEIDVDLPDPERAFAELSARIAAEGAGSTESDVGFRAAAERGSAPDGAGPVSRGASGATRDRRAEWAAVAEWAFDDADDSEAERAELAASGNGRVIQGPWGRSNLWAAAAAILLMAGGALVGSMISDLRVDSQSKGLYETASARVPGTHAIDAGARIDVVFQPTATAAEISNALRQVGVEIVAGPTQLGVYRVRVASAQAEGRDASRVDAEAAVAQLKALPTSVVMFAESVP